jgi:DNA polymerase (family X)
LDNHAIARILREIADLLEIKGDNPFKIRAYRNGADIVSNHPHAFATLDAGELRQVAGIGKDLASRIREIAETGGTQIHRDLLAEFPATILDLIGLQGVGPKTVATFYRELNVRTLEDLERAAKDGRIRGLRGMGLKKQEQILKALDARKRHGGRHLLPDCHDAADAAVAYLREQAPTATIEAVGSLRRGCETCGDIDILASGADAALMTALTEYPGVERVLSLGDTRSSVQVAGNFQIDLRVVAPDSRGAALQYFTGSKAHNIALRDRAISMGFKLNEYGLFRVADDVKEAGAEEADIYRVLGLPWIPPELREARGEIEAALEQSLPRLVDRADLLGDLHMHTTESDGKDTIADMVEAARAAGLEYVAITDHTQSLAMANGLDERRTLDHAKRIRAVDATGGGVRVMAGAECDIRPDGTLDLSDDCLSALDIVIASVHSALNQDREQMTDRVLRALENPNVDVLAHPTGRRLLRREPFAIDMEAIVRAAARHGVALEINCQVERLDLNDVHAKLASEHDVPIVISSDGHSRNSFARLRWGVLMARRGWLEPRHVLNTRSFDDLKASLRRHKKRPS